jgi:hypothetical protein
MPAACVENGRIRFLGEELLDLIHNPFAIEVAIRLDRYSTTHQPQA